MITIGEYTKEGFADYPPDYFVPHFLEICNAHRTANRALLFAFLLYDFNHPDVIKVLRDKDYWNSLDSLSGNKLSVFAFHAPAAREGNVKGNRLPQFTEPIQILLRQRFGVSNLAPTSMPAIMFFQVADGRIVGQYLARLKGTGIENAFKELNSILKDAVSAVSNVLPEFFGNSEEIFNLVRGRLENRKFVDSVQKGASTILSVEKLAKQFAGFFSNSAQ